MAHEVETMFFNREKPWHGLGVRVESALTSEEALCKAGLDWEVFQEPIYVNGEMVDGYKANVRNSDRKVLGIVGSRYQVIQNKDAFAFTDALLGEGVRYETAGSLLGGKKVWVLAKLPQEFIFAGDRVSPYLVFTNTHDGSGSVRVACTPVRVVCNNTLSLALSTAKRSWSSIHTGKIQEKLQDAYDTLFLAGKYLEELGKEINMLQDKRLTEGQVSGLIEKLIPVDDKASDQQKKNIKQQREDLQMRYFDAPDLSKLGNSAYRFINAVSDHATHAAPLRLTKNYKDNLFQRTLDGHPLIDQAYQLVKVA